MRGALRVAVGDKRAAPDLAANEAGWKTFLKHPDFLKMNADPKYADTFPNITKLYLEPTDYSQV